MTQKAETPKPTLKAHLIFLLLVLCAMWAVTPSSDHSDGRVSVGNSKYESVDWDRQLCNVTLHAYATQEYPVPHYIRYTCKEVLEKGITGAKWKNEAGECAEYRGLTLVRCMDKIFD